MIDVRRNICDSKVYTRCTEKGDNRVDKKKKLQDELDRIEKKQQSFHDEIEYITGGFTNRLEVMQSEINALRQQILQLSSSSPEVSEKSKQPVSVEDYAQAAQVSAAKPEELTIELESPHFVDQTPEKTLSSPNGDECQSPRKATIESPQVPVEPAPLEIFFNKLGTLFVAMLLNAFSIMSVPVISAFTSVTKLYRHYQEQGKAPIFLMMSAGIVAMSFGFAYMLQYAFNNVFTPVHKVLLGYGTSVAIAALGMWISARQAAFREYAASVIALGIVTAYVTAYFMGIYYEIASTTVTLVAMSVVTLTAYTLAIYYETRIVALIGLVGGLLTPFIFNNFFTLDTPVLFPERQPVLVLLAKMF